jgi:hypothetical protein
MRSYPKCTPPNEPQAWNELAAFRETALRHFTRPEDRAALKRLGELLTEGALEQAHLWPAYEGTETANAVAAVCRDLEHSLHVLQSLADSRHLSDLPAREQTLSATAASTLRHHFRPGLAPCLRNRVTVTSIRPTPQGDRYSEIR